MNRGASGDIWSRTRAQWATCRSSNSRKLDKSESMSYLKSMEERDDNTIVSEVLTEKSRLRQIMEACPQDMVPAMLSLLAKVCTSSTPQKVSQCLWYFQQSTFLLKDVTDYIVKLPTSLSTYRNLNEILLTMIHLSRLLHTLLTKMPHSYTSVATIVSSLQYVCTEVKKGADINSMDQVTQDLLKKMDSEVEILVGQRQATEMIIREEPKPRHKDETRSQPLEDFRKMSIHPSTSDILGTAPSLIPNKSKGKYPSPVAYLDTQFRLLREDFVGPLRDAVMEYKSLKQLKQPKESKVRLQDGRVYTGVHLRRECFGKDGIAHSIRFDVSHMFRVNWQSSRRLIFGSLVCLSDDDFNTFLLATVSERDPDKLKHGEVQIIFLNDVDIKAIGQKEFVMVETSAYFEAYRPVLEALQRVDANSFPFSRYIVQCCTDVNCPSYLTNSGTTTYDLSALKSKRYTGSNVRCVSIFEKGKWPDLSALDLDSSQLEAIKTALTKEFVIIQGPPGTGKTYVGLKIVQVILENRAKWLAEEPILVVCYTNHALDQFLEEIDNFLGGGIVRVGGRSKSDKMEKYLLKNLRRKQGRRNLYMQNTEDIQTIIRIIENTKRSVANSQTNLIPYDQLQTYMTNEQRTSFETGAKNQKLNINEIVRSWLRLGVPIGNSVEIPRHFKDAAEGVLVWKLDAQNDNELFLEVKEVENTERRQPLEKLCIEDRWRHYRFLRQQFWMMLVSLHDFYQSQNFKVGVDETNARIQALGSGIIHEAYLMDFDEELKMCSYKYRGRHSYMLYWLRLNSERILTGQSFRAESHNRSPIKGKTRIQEMCVSNVSHYFAYIPSENDYQQHGDIVANISTNLFNHTSTEEATRLESIEDLYLLDMSQRWSLYVSWRDKFHELVLVPEDVLKRSSHQVLDYETNAKINGLYTGILHERYLNDITDKWVNMKGCTHSEILHWLGLQHLCSCTQHIIKEAAQPDDAGFIIEDESSWRRDQQEYGETWWDEKLATQSQKCFNDSWKTVDRKARSQAQSQIESQMKIRNSMSKQEAQRIQNVWDLSEGKRWKLYRFWRNEFIEHQEMELDALAVDYNDACRKANELRIQEDMQTMRTATVVGMTTTCAAKYRAALEQINPKIVIVEEAAEVLEAHIVTTLSEGCQHLILIGDHKQLRPNPNVYELAKRYNLEISLFERMINNGIAFNTLRLQHRMRPEIAALMEPVYPELQNHDIVNTYENVKGVSHNLYFIDHKEQETSNQELRSKSNQHEVEYITALCEYFLKQGYTGSQITILTLYTGQVLKIKDVMYKARLLFQGVHLAAVDNFQGEENDIILLSLVRSNNEGSIGFLKIQNRVTVALSRAKVGLYVIGNFSLLSSSTSLWRKLVSKMKTAGTFGMHLKLCCQRHPNDVIEANKAEDFSKAPDGGCMRKCEARLKCGHVCTLYCHPKDPEHIKFKCMKPCAKKCKEGHKCQKKCYQMCLCEEKVTKLIERCGHEQEMCCHESPSTFICQAICDKDICNDGHKCPRTCHKGKKCLPCKVVVEKTIPECGHVIRLPCSQTTSRRFCNSKCEKKCKAGHDCKKLCKQVCDPCPVLVKKVIGKCGHTQEMLCSQESDSFECKEKCDHRCNRGHPCTQLCYEKCKPCMVPVETELPVCHHLQTIRCHEDPSSVKCRFSVAKQLKSCGHLQNMECWVSPDKVKCDAQCENTCENGHRCNRKCSDDCGRCTFAMDKKINKCGHTQNMVCSQDPETFDCKEKCERQCPEGHPCSQLCHEKCQPCEEIVERSLPRCKHTKKMQCFVDPSSVKCTVRVKKVLPSCQHYQEMECWVPESSFLCQMRCERKCSNKHRCLKLCSEACGKCCILMPKEMKSCKHVRVMPCHQATENSKCEALVEKKLPWCGHSQLLMCYEDPADVNCKHPCSRERPCGHKCPLQCYEDCGTCKELVSKTIHPCGHTVLVHCSRKSLSIKCKKPCDQILACGHKCPNYCHETCASVCEETEEKLNPRCGHKVKLPCYLRPDSIICAHPCQDCHHPCGRLCGFRCQDTCRFSLNVTLECGHQMEAECREVIRKKDGSKFSACDYCTGQSSDGKEKVTRKVIKIDSQNNGVLQTPPPNTIHQLDVRPKTCTKKMSQHAVSSVKARSTDVLEPSSMRHNTDNPEPKDVMSKTPRKKSKPMSRNGNDVTSPCPQVKTMTRDVKPKTKQLQLSKHWPAKQTSQSPTSVKPAAFTARHVNGIEKVNSVNSTGTGNSKKKAHEQRPTLLETKQLGQAKSKKSPRDTCRITEQSVRSTSPQKYTNNSEPKQSGKMNKPENKTRELQQSKQCPPKQIPPSPTAVKPKTCDTKESKNVKGGQEVKSATSTSKHCPWKKSHDPKPRSLVVKTRDGKADNRPPRDAHGITEKFVRPTSYHKSVPKRGTQSESRTKRRSVGLGSDNKVQQSADGNKQS